MRWLSPPSRYSMRARRHEDHGYPMKRVAVPGHGVAGFEAQPTAAGMTGRVGRRSNSTPEVPHLAHDQPLATVLRLDQPGLRRPEGRRRTVGVGGRSRLDAGDPVDPALSGSEPGGIRIASAANSVGATESLTLTALAYDSHMPATTSSARDMVSSSFLTARAGRSARSRARSGAPPPGRSPLKPRTHAPCPGA